MNRSRSFSARVRAIAASSAAPTSAPIAAVAAFTAVLLAAPASPAAPLAYPWRPAESTILIRTDRGGLFARMGHRHEIRAQSFTGSLEFDPAVIEATPIDLVIAAASLKVLDPEVDPEDVAKIQRDMETKVLEIAKFPEIRFLSSSVNVEDVADGGGWRVQLSGSLALHGVGQPISFPATLTPEGESIRLRGETTIRQKDFEIDPISVGLGAVTVKNEVRIVFDVVAGAPDAVAETDSTAAPDAPASPLEDMTPTGAPAASDSAAAPAAPE